MEQELWLATLGPEHAIPGDHSIPNKISIEVLADRGGERVELLGSLRRALRLTKELCVAAKLLVNENDRPGARHPVALGGVNRSQRIIPVAIAVPNEVRAANEASAHRLD